MTRNIRIRAIWVVMLMAVGAIAAVGIGVSANSANSASITASCTPNPVATPGASSVSLSIACTIPVQPAVTVTVTAPPPVTTTTKPPVTTPPVTTTTAPPSGSTGTTLTNAYVTGYGWPDNSPPGDVTSGLSGHAGGTGTYADPVTLAVGYVGSKLDYPYGTKFYIPAVRKYFVVGDTCAACHNKPSGASVWVDMWVGGNGSNNAAVLACEDSLTANRSIILNPDANRPVVAGALFNGSCSATY